MSTDAPTTNANRCGLRFDRASAPKLHDLANRVKAADLKGDHAAFSEAAQAAELGEPMIVHFEEIEEAAAMVGMYVLYGIAQPEIVELSGG